MLTFEIAVQDCTRQFSLNTTVPLSGVFNKNCKFYESRDYKNIINNFGYFELIKCTDINSKKNIVKNYISKFWFASLLKEIQYLMTSQEKKIFLSNTRNEAEFIIDELQDPPKKIQGLINNQKYKCIFKKTFKV